MLSRVVWYLIVSIPDLCTLTLSPYCIILGNFYCVICFLSGTLKFSYLELKNTYLELQIFLIWSFNIFLSGALNVSYLEP